MKMNLRIFKYEMFLPRPGFLLMGTLMLGLAGPAWKPVAEAAMPPKKFQFDPAKLFMNKPAPKVVFETFITKQPVALADFKDKKAVLLNFFATWCGPCKNETPHFVKWHEIYGKDVEFISVDVMEKEGTDPTKDLEEYLKTFGIKWTMTIDDADRFIAREFRIKGLPLNIGIDKSGVVRFYHTGGVEESWLKNHLEWLATGKKPEEILPPKEEKAQETPIKEDKDGIKSEPPKAENSPEPVKP